MTLDTMTLYKMTCKENACGKNDYRRNNCKEIELILKNFRKNNCIKMPCRRNAM